MSSSESHTPGSRRTPFTPVSTPGRSPSVIVAIVEGRGLARGEIGMASIDLQKPVVIMSQFSDSQTYVKTMTKLQILQPLEIVMPVTACENGNNTKMFELISDQYQMTQLASVQRKYFNEERGLQYIRHLCLPEYSAVEMEVKTKYYCLATVAALLKYTEFIQSTVYAPSSLKMVFTGSEQTTMIDVSTVVNLELLQNIKQPQSEHTLYGVLNYTKTRMGARLLRSNILQPPCNQETIFMRQDAVAELVENEDMFYSIQAVVKRFLDIDHLLSILVQIPKQESVKAADTTIANVIYLTHTMALTEPLADALKECKNDLLKAYAKTLEDPRFPLVMATISKVINSDLKFQKGSINMRNLKCSAIKPGINGLLDITRETFSEYVDEIHNLVQEYATKYSLPLKVGSSMSRGFFMQLYCGGKSNFTAESLPGSFIKVTKFKNTLSFTSTDMIRLNDRANEAQKQIYVITNTVMGDLLNKIRQYFGCLYQLSECVAMLDMLVSFAHSCTLSDYVRPDFTDTLAVNQCKHPILDKIIPHPPVPNDVYASEESNFITITGPNMSGKSTYLRQIALLQIMAQIGSFVPAIYASFRIADHIFSRIGSDNSIDNNVSTFTTEMKEINYIIQCASNNSLIIIDELGRGTSAEEGVGICHAICEYLLKLKAFSFFATHFMELTSLADLYPNVENYHFEVQRSFSEEGQCDKVLYSHILSKGKTKETHYGIQLAEVSTLPRKVVDDAKKLSIHLSEQKEKSKEISEESRRLRASFRLANRLIQTATNSRLDNNSLRGYLKSLKTDYLQEIQSSHSSIEEE